VFGSDDPGTLATRINLASWRAEAGDLAEAVADFAQLLSDRLRVLGPDHPATPGHPQESGLLARTIR
jgi:hypothetical protein